VSREEKKKKIPIGAVEQILRFGNVKVFLSECAFYFIIFYAMQWIEDTPQQQQDKENANNALLGFRTFIETRQEDTLDEIDFVSEILRKNRDLVSDDAARLLTILQNNGLADDPRPLDFSGPVQALSKALRSRVSKKNISVLAPHLEELHQLLLLSADVDAEILKELDVLRGTVGLYQVKASMVGLFFAHIKGIRRAAATGNNFVFGGNPGTGKTTIARVLGKIMVLLGFLAPRDEAMVQRISQAVSAKDKLPQLSRTLFQGLAFISRADEKDDWVVSQRYDDYVMVTSRESFVASFEGQTVEKTILVLLLSLGKMLFIDEAYALVSGRNDEFGIEALNTLVNWIPELGDTGQTIFSVAGYYDRLRDDFFRQNQGLGSRFPNRFFFPNYTPPQLASIFDSTLERIGWSLERIPSANGVEALLLEIYEEIADGVEERLRTTHQHTLMPEVQAPVLTSSDNPTPTDKGQFLVHFFDVFSRVFETGNVRKLQNYIDSITNLWMQSRLLELRASGTSPDAQWLRELSMRIEPSIMYGAMSRMLLDLYTGFESEGDQVKLREDQVDAFRARIENTNTLAGKLEEIRDTLERLVSVSSGELDSSSSATEDWLTQQGKRRKIRAQARVTRSRETVSDRYYDQVVNQGNEGLLATLDESHLRAILLEIYKRHGNPKPNEKIDSLCTSKRNDIVVRCLVREIKRFL